MRIKIRTGNFLKHPKKTTFYNKGRISYFKNMRKGQQKTRPNARQKDRVGLGLFIRAGNKYNKKLYIIPLRLRVFAVKFSFKTGNKKEHFPCNWIIFSQLQKHPRMRSTITGTNNILSPAGGGVRLSGRGWNARKKQKSGLTPACIFTLSNIS